jgi:D-glycero-D-manno-heptose 1,7-bisphosphate phosphatase
MRHAQPAMVERAGVTRRDRAIFLDKDGTLIENVPYNVDPALVALAPGAGPALRGLAERGFRLVVVSNQSGVAEGWFAERALRAVEQRIAELLAPSDVAIEAFYYCVHSATAGCSCRKPRPGLVRRASAELRITTSASWLVGDILDDVEAAHRAGCRAALVMNGNETEWRYGMLRVPEIAAMSLEQVASEIVAAEDASSLEAEAPDGLAGRH